MAIIINKQTTTPHGAVIPSLYCRIWHDLGLSGKVMTICTKDFASEQAFRDGLPGLGNTLPFTEFPYGRGNDGTDQLLFAHNTVKNWLVAQGIAAENEIQIEL